ncbi:MAG: twin-arginine translocase TatA/TatE family subunit [Planctomycetota bacterium]|nr:twin-arginine translocase TatA/TatE family subunit [Planctomycetota bacterium]
MPGGAEWILIALFGLLIFGKRLPEVGRSLGKGIVEFKKGLKGVEDEVEESSSRSRLRRGIRLHRVGFRRHGVGGIASTKQTEACRGLKVGPRSVRSAQGAASLYSGSRLSVPRARRVQSNALSGCLARKKRKPSPNPLPEYRERGESGCFACRRACSDVVRVRWEI